MQGTHRDRFNSRLYLQRRGTGAPKKQTSPWRASLAGSIMGMSSTVRSSVEDEDGHGEEEKEEEESPSKSRSQYHCFSKNNIRCEVAQSKHIYKNNSHVKKVKRNFIQIKFKEYRSKFSAL